MTILDIESISKTAFEESKHIEQSFWLSAVDQSGFEILSIWYPRKIGHLKPLSKEYAHKKAFTAFSRNQPTGALAHHLDVEERTEYLADLRTNSNFINLLGGLPIYSLSSSEAYDCNSILIGGLGVSGLKPKEDLELAFNVIKHAGYGYDCSWIDLISGLR